jgi:hypothetical protein
MNNHFIAAHALCFSDTVRGNSCPFPEVQTCPKKRNVLLIEITPKRPAIGIILEEPLPPLPTVQFLVDIYEILITSH